MNGITDEISRRIQVGPPGLTWEQKVKAMQALGTVEFFMREPGDWSCSVLSVNVKDGCMLTSNPSSGSDPAAAASKRWDNLTKLARGQYLVVSKAGVRRAVKWNGFMWEDVEEATI